jgi:Helix-hairpin-helix motif
LRSASADPKLRTFAHWPTRTPHTQLLDSNTATEAELCALKGVGDVRAANVIKNRPYKGKDELVQKNIIPAAVYAGIKDKIIAKQQSTSRRCVCREVGLIRAIGQASARARPGSPVLFAIAPSRSASSPLLL